MKVSRTGLIRVQTWHELACEVDADDMRELLRKCGGAMKITIRETTAVRAKTSCGTSSNELANLLEERNSATVNIVPSTPAS